MEEKKSIFSRLGKFFKGLAVTLGFIRVLAPGADANAQNPQEINLNELKGEYNPNISQEIANKTQTVTKEMKDGRNITLNLDKNNPVAVIKDVKDAVNAVENVTNGNGNVDILKVVEAAEKVDKVIKTTETAENEKPSSQILNNPETENKKTVVESKAEKSIDEIVEKANNEVEAKSVAPEAKVVEMSTAEATQKAQSIADYMFKIYKFDYSKGYHNRVERSRENLLEEVIVHLRAEKGTYHQLGQSAIEAELDKLINSYEAERIELTTNRLNSEIPAEKETPAERVQAEAVAENAVAESVKESEKTEEAIIVENAEKASPIEENVKPVEENIKADDVVVADSSNKKVETKVEKVEQAKEYKTYKKKEKADSKRIYSWEEISRVGKDLDSILDDIPAEKSDVVSSKKAETSEVKSTAKDSVSKSNVNFTEADLNKILDDSDSKKGVVNEAKLNETIASGKLSADQMGTMETLEDEQEVVVQKKQPGVIDESKLGNVSMGQMGVLEEDEVASREEVMAALKEAQATGQRVTDKRILAGLQKMRIEDAKKKQGMER